MVTPIRPTPKPEAQDRGLVSSLRSLLRGTIGAPQILRSREQPSKPAEEARWSQPVARRKGVQYGQKGLRYAQIPDYSIRTHSGSLHACARAFAEVSGQECPASAKDYIPQLRGDLHYREVDAAGKEYLKVDDVLVWESMGPGAAGLKNGHLGVVVMGADGKPKYISYINGRVVIKPITGKPVVFRKWR